MTKKKHSAKEIQQYKGHRERELWLGKKKKMEEVNTWMKGQLVNVEREVAKMHMENADVEQENANAEQGTEE